MKDWITGYVIEGLVEPFLLVFCFGGGIYVMAAAVLALTPILIVRDQPNLSWDAAKTWRCSSARKIIEAGRGKDALRIVLESRLCPDV